jgi:hypothetical protein
MSKLQRTAAHDSRELSKLKHTLQVRAVESAKHNRCVGWNKPLTCGRVRATAGA